MDSSTGRLLALLLYCLALMGQTSVGDPIPQDTTVNQDLSLVKFTLTGLSLQICTDKVLLDVNVETLKSCSLIYKQDGNNNEPNLNTDDVAGQCATFLLPAALPTISSTFDMVVEVEITDGLILKTGSIAFTPQTYSAVKVTCGSDPDPLYRVAGPGGSSTTASGCLVDPAPEDPLTDVCYTVTDLSQEPFCYSPIPSDPFNVCLHGIIKADPPQGIADEFQIVSLNYPTEPQGGASKFTAKYSDPSGTIETIEVLVRKEGLLVGIYHCPSIRLPANKNHDCDLLGYEPADAQYDVCAVAFSDGAPDTPKSTGTTVFRDLNAFSYEQGTQFVVGFVNSNTGVGVALDLEKKYVVTYDSTDADTITIDCSSIETGRNCYGFFTDIEPGNSRTVTVAFGDNSNAIIFSYIPPTPNE